MYRTWGMGVLLVVAGCGGDARVELSAADAVTAVAGQMDGALAEYHKEVSRADDAREGEVVRAFVARVRADSADSEALDQHSEQFGSALARIRQDRETEWSRRSAVAENVQVLREIAKGLQRIGLQSLSLQDEMRRYLETWMQARQRAETVNGATTNKG